DPPRGAFEGLGVCHVVAGGCHPVGDGDLLAGPGLRALPQEPGLNQMSDRLAGVLLFLPVPVVLVLFTLAPLGAWASLVLGVALMATHRLYARPWALARAQRRCLWCGGTATAPVGAEIEEPGGRTPWACCSLDHAHPLRSLLSWASRRAWFLRIGILG